MPRLLLLRLVKGIGYIIKTSVTTLMCERKNFLEETAQSPLLTSEEDRLNNIPTTKKIRLFAWFTL
mgnify:CR=1 FL=1